MMCLELKTSTSGPLLEEPIALKCERKPLGKVPTS